MLAAQPPVTGYRVVLVRGRLADTERPEKVMPHVDQFGTNEAVTPAQAFGTQPEAPVPKCASIAGRAALLVWARAALLVWGEALLRSGGGRAASSGRAALLVSGAGSGAEWGGRPAHRSA